MALVKVQVAGVGIDSKSEAFFVALTDERDTILPILIGPFEAQGISTKLMGYDSSRPIVYDTIKTILEATHTKVKSIVVNALAEDTFFAQITLDAGGMEFSLDSRPSDAIAIALRCEAPIYVTDSVMQKAGVPLTALPKQESVSPESAVTLTENSVQNKLKRLKLELKRLVEREEFQQAALVRDQILELEKGES